MINSALNSLNSNSLKASKLVPSQHLGFRVSSRVNAFTLNPESRQAAGPTWYQTAQSVVGLQEPMGPGTSPPQDFKL